MSDLRSLAAVRAAVVNGRKLTYLLFWGHRAKGDAVGKWCLSQWWPAPFVVDGIKYPTAEHYMMAAKARLFGDEEAVRLILSSPDPAKAKGAGRSVKGFDQVTWDTERFECVVRGNAAKFAQNPQLRSYLAGLPEDVLVEASPVDLVWGIGLAATDEGASNPLRWPGLNLLGFGLMEVRDRLRAGTPYAAG